MDVQDIAGCLRAQDHGHPPVVCYGFDAYQHHCWRESDTFGPLTTGCSVRGDTPLVVCFGASGYANYTEGVPTLRAKGGDLGGGGEGLIVYEKPERIIDHSRRHNYQELEKVPTLEARMGTGGGNVPLVLKKLPSYKEVHDKAVCYGISSFESNAMLSNNPNSGIYEAKTCRTLDLNGGNPACNQGGIMVVEPKVTGALCANSHPGSYTGQDAFNNMLPVIKQDSDERKYILRRLTPTECARLQGFPDWWTDGAEGSDSAIYKMWGNGIALPCAADVIGRLAKELNNGNGED